MSLNPKTSDKKLHWLIFNCLRKSTTKEYVFNKEASFSWKNKGAFVA